MWFCQEVEKSLPVYSMRMDYPKECEKTLQYLENSKNGVFQASGYNAKDMNSTFVEVILFSLCM